MPRGTSHYLVVLIVIGAAAGALCGWQWGPAMQPVAFLGTFFLNALKMVVVPLVLCSIIVGVSSLGDIRRIGGIGWKTLLYYFATTALAILLGLMLVNLLQPGVDASTASAVLTPAAQQATSFQDLFLSFVHPNLFGAMAETKILPIIVFALIFGGVLTTLGDKGRVALQFFEAVNEAIIKVVQLILWMAPIGVFALVAGKLGASGGGAAFLGELAKVGKYTITVLIGLAIHGFIVLPVILRVFGRRNPFRYMWGMMEALVTALATSSSSATLPVTLRAAKVDNDIPEAAADFVLPIGATINMDGTALYEAVAAMFVAQAYGIELSVMQQGIIFLTAAFASIGAAGIPQAGLVTMVLVFQAVGLPLEGIGIILAVDWFLDRFRTVVNVWGDAVGAAVIAKTREVQSLTTAKSHDYAA